jgi:hypothetical protein
MTGSCAYSENGYWGQLLGAAEGGRAQAAVPGAESAPSVSIVNAAGGAVWDRE